MVLEANFEECKAALEEQMEPYAAMVVTEDSIKSAKADLAMIRKIKERVEESRKTVKKLYNQPLTEFEAKCKSLTSVCDEAIQNLDGQVKEFQQREREEKITGLRAYFEGCVGNMASYLSWESVLNPRWANATYKIEDATTEIDQAVARCTQDIASLLQLESPFEATLLDCYRTTHDLGACLRRQKELEYIQEQAQRRKAEQEARQKTSQLLEPMAPMTPMKPMAPKEAEGETSTAPKKAKTRQLDVRLWVTNEQLGALKTYLTRNRIRYGPVPKEG